jgi:hypothetical protein
MLDGRARGAVTFERWAFEVPEAADLEVIDVLPLLDASGSVDPANGLIQPGGAGSQPVGLTGRRRKVTVKWTTKPSRVTSVSRWRASLIPAEGEYSPEEEAEADLPSTTAAGKTRRVSVPLAIDLDDMPIRAVQVHIVGLDEHGGELRDAAGNVVEGRSSEFWLESEEDDLVPTSDGQPRAESVATRPLARVRAAMRLDDDEIAEAAGHWTTGDIDAYQFTMNGRHTARILVPGVLRQIEERRLQSFSHVAYEATVDAGDHLTIEMVGEHELEVPGDLGDRLASRRRDLFRKLSGQQGRGTIATSEWSSDLARSSRSYAAAFREALDGAGDASTRLALLSMDTLRLTLQHPAGNEPAVLVLPTHPLRVLWYSAYSELLSEWERQLLSAPRGARPGLLDVALLERVVPINVPALLPLGADPFLFVQNLRFFWSLHLPLGALDPARRVGDVAAAVGLGPEEALLTDLPPRRVSDELQAYTDVHPYLKTLRISIVNPGTGAFLTEVLRRPGELSDEADASPRRTNLDLLLHYQRPLPLEVSTLEQFQRSLYEMRTSGASHPLTPLCAIAVRPVEDLTDLPGGDVNITMAFDTFRPKLEAAGAEERDSASFFGLLMRMLPSFETGDGNARWEYRLALPEDVTRERHPVTPGYTNDLVDSHRAWLQNVAQLTIAAGADDTMPALVAHVGPEERAQIDTLHARSDWVIFLDRFLGVDLFDYPRDPDLERVSRRYLLDYTPEFLEGLGHRMVVTTAHRDEVSEILGQAMSELGFAAVEESVGEVLQHLKTISGRLALRVVGDSSRAREAVSLGVVAAYLRARGELDDSILIPVDAHPEIFGVHARRDEATPRVRCDLLRVRFQRGRMLVTFIEVKSRGAAGRGEELANRMVDQIEATEEVVRELFFRRDPRRLDHVLQRSRLATILRFYLNRAWRHGIIASDASMHELEASISRLEGGIPDMRPERRGYIVNLAADPEPPLRIRGSVIQLVTARDVLELGMQTEGPSGDGHSPTGPAPPRDVSHDSSGPDGSQPDSAESGADEASRDRSLTESPGENDDDSSPQRADEAEANARAETGQPPSAAADEPPGETTGQESHAAPTLEPTVAAAQITAVLGRTSVDQTDVLWQPSVRGSPHLFIVGIPGQGKSWTVTRLLLELTRNGVPALVFDFHGQFSDPSGAYARAAEPRVLDAARGLPFSPFEAQSSRDAGTSYWQTNAFVVAEIFEYVCDLGDIQRDVVYEAIRDAYQAVGFDTGKPSRLPTVAEVASRLEELEQERRVRNVVPRCRPLLEFGLFSDDGDGQMGAFDEILQRGTVLDVSTQGLETLQLAAGAFVLRKVYKEMFRWGETDQLRLVVVLDEAHRLARDITLPKIMKEGRKFGVAAVVASQGLADFHADVVGNAGTKVVFRTNFPMSKKVAGFLRGPARLDLASAIEQLSVGEAFVQTPEMTTAGRVWMTPPGNSQSPQ